MDKDTLIKQVSENLGISEDIIFKVVAFQGEDALKAVKIHNEIEFSGFGKFYLSQRKLKNYITGISKGVEKLRNQPDKEEKVNQLDTLLENLNKKVR